MGYAWESVMDPVVWGEDQLDPIATQGPGDKVIGNVLYPTTVFRLAILVTTDMTVTAAVIALDRRVLAGSDVGRVEVARITVPVAVGVGKVVYKDFDPVDVDPGDQLVLELITASTAGGGLIWVGGYPRAETMPNVPDAILSV